jgi:hypothetical protein|tara:strand:- start:3 stop:206 length:204 start_codon:yes stop_codon:yes gene_type:complete
MSDDGYITSKDLSGKRALTGVARKDAEKRKEYEALLNIAIAKVEEEREKAVEKDLKKKKVTKKKKST